MNLAEFVKSSERTLAGGELKINQQQEINLLHSAIGVSTEVGEIQEALGMVSAKLDVVNLAEESADVMWYLTIPIRDYGLDLGKLNSLAPTEFDVPKLIIDSAEYLDMMKKVAFYGKPVNGFDVDHHVCNIYQHIVSMAFKFGFDLGTALGNNQDKLRARFPEKFETEQALNRNLTDERTELEKGM